MERTGFETSAYMKPRHGQLSYVCTRWLERTIGRHDGCLGRSGWPEFVDDSLIFADSNRLHRQRYNNIFAIGGADGIQTSTPFPRAIKVEVKTDAVRLRAAFVFAQMFEGSGSVEFVLAQVTLQYARRALLFRGSNAHGNRMLHGPFAHEAAYEQRVAWQLHVLSR